MAAHEVPNYHDYTCEWCGHVCEKTILGLCDSCEQEYIFAEMQEMQNIEIREMQETIAAEEEAWQKEMGED